MSKKKYLSILFVENEDITRETVCEVLSRKFKNVIQASNGKEGLSKFKKNKPDIVITDINMPVMNGIDMIKQIREFDKNIKIIVLSAHSEADYFIQAINLRVDKFVIKPINILELIRILEKYFFDIRLRKNIPVLNDNIIFPELTEINSIIRNYKLISSEMTILIVENDDIVREANVRYFLNKNIKVYSAANGKEGLAAYEKFKPNIVFTEITMPTMNGIEMIKRIREKDKSTKIVLFSAHSDSDYFIEAIDLKIDKFLLKPISSTEIYNVAERLSKEIIIDWIGYKTPETYSSIKNITRMISYLCERRKYKAANALYKNRFIQENYNVIQNYPAYREGLDCHLSFLKKKNQQLEEKKELDDDIVEFHRFGAAFCTFLLGNIYESRKNWDICCEYFLKVKDIESYLTCSASIALTEVAKGKLSEAINILKNAFKKISKNFNDIDISNELCIIAYCEFLLGHSVESMKYFNDAFSNLSKSNTGFNHFVARAGTLYAEFLIRMNAWDQFVEVNDFNIEVSKKNNWNDILAVCLILQGWYDIYQNNLSHAKSILDKAQKILHNSGMFAETCRLNFVLAFLEETKTNYEKALSIVNDTLPSCTEKGFLLLETDFLVLRGSIQLQKYKLLDEKDYNLLKRAGVNLETALDISNRSGFAWNKMKASELLSLYYVGKTNLTHNDSNIKTEKATFYIDQAISIKKKILLTQEQLNNLSIKEDITFKTLKSKARELLIKGEYLEARKSFLSLINKYRRYSDNLREELGFIYNFDLDESKDKNNWIRKSGQINWRKQIWGILSEKENFDALSKSNESYEVSSNIEKEKIQQNELEATDLPRDPNKKGEKLEVDTLALLELLFHFENDDKNRILSHLSQQKRGTQFGFDIKLTYCQSRINSNVKCLIECKSQETNITIDTIAGKIVAAETFHKIFDHWILIAPRASLSNDLKIVLDRWEEEKKHSFKVHVWTKDTEIKQLFGLIPKLYEQWFGYNEIDHPSKWSSIKKDDIIAHWLKKIEPFNRLPKGWNNYIEKDRNLRILCDEQQNKLEFLAKTYILPQGNDETGTPLPLPLFDYVQEWLENSNNIMVLLGDFGDGKTIFTYLLAKKLIEDFRKNNSTWIPLRFSLRDFSRPGIKGGRDFLRRRLEEFGADINSWIDLTNKYKVLVILDGLDEISKSLDSTSLNDSFEMLLDCCKTEFADQKIIITCRTPFFKGLPDSEYLISELNNPFIVYLRNFDRNVVFNKLILKAETQKDKLKIIRLRNMHDPIGLATKPLFYEMISETILDQDADCTSVMSLYDGYVIKSLKRKYEFLKHKEYHKTEKTLVNNMIEILEKVALNIHCSEKEYICLNKLTTGKNIKYAKSLWEIAINSNILEQDATSRIGVRSLLRKVEIQDNDIHQDDWPVDFCHRSLREYFVARKIENLIRESIDEARRILASFDLSYEIILFTSELIHRHKTLDVCHRVLRSFTEESRVNSGNDSLTQIEKRRLGRNAITLLYKSEGKLSESDWEGMTLDGANLSGANLSGKNFSHASLINAHLENVDFTNSNFCNANLTGVLLEETTEVSSISSFKSGDGFVASYSDGKVRMWNFVLKNERSSYITFEAQAKSMNRTEVAAFPGSDIVLYFENKIIFADNSNNGHKKVASFKVRPSIMRITFKEKSILVIEEKIKNSYIANLFDLNSMKKQEIELGSSWFCDSLSSKAIVRADVGGNVLLQSINAPNNFELNLNEKVSTSALTVSSHIIDSENLFYIACGEQNGILNIWKCNTEKGEFSIQEIYRKKIHYSAITSLAFIDDYALLTGGSDKKIFRIDLDKEKQVSPDFKEFSISVKCKDINIDGLKSEKERVIFQSYKDKYTE